MLQVINLPMGDLTPTCVNFNIPFSVNKFTGHFTWRDIDDADVGSDIDPDDVRPERFIKDRQLQLDKMKVRKADQLKREHEDARKDQKSRGKKARKDVRDGGETSSDEESTDDNYVVCPGLKPLHLGQEDTYFKVPYCHGYGEQPQHGFAYTCNANNIPQDGRKHFIRAMRVEFEEQNLGGLPKSCCGS